MPTEATATVDTSAAQAAVPAVAAGTVAPAPIVDPKAPPAADKGAAPAPDPKMEADKVAAASIAAKEAAETDEIAKSLANLNHELRAAKAERDKYKGESTKLADKVTQAEQLGKARDALKGKDYVSALRSLDPDLSVDEAILTLIEQAKAADAVPMSQADIERITAQKIEEDRRGQQAAREKEVADSLARATETYTTACASEFTPDAFPLIAALGVTDKQIQEHVEGIYKAGKPIPSPAETMRHFEADYENRLKSRGFTRAQIAEAKADAVASAAVSAPSAKPAPTAPVIDTMGGNTRDPAPEKVETMKEYDARIKAQFRALRGQTAGARQ